MKKILLSLTLLLASIAANAEFLSGNYAVTAYFDNTGRGFQTLFKMSCSSNGTCTIPNGLFSDKGATQGIYPATASYYIDVKTRGLVLTTPNLGGKSVRLFSRGIPFYPTASGVMDGALITIKTGGYETYGQLRRVSTKFPATLACNNMTVSGQTYDISSLITQTTTTRYGVSSTVKRVNPATLSFSPTMVTFTDGANVYTAGYSVGADCTAHVYGLYFKGALLSGNHLDFKLWSVNQDTNKALGVFVSSFNDHQSNKLVVNKIRFSSYGYGIKR